MRLLGLVLLVLAGGCDHGKTLEIQLAPSCDLSTAATVEIAILAAGLAPRSETHTAAELFGPSGPARLLLLLPESATSVEVTVRVLAVGGAERATGRLQVTFDGPASLQELMTLGGSGCQAASDLGGDSGFDLATPDLADPCGVLRLSGGSANTAPRDSVYNPAGAFTVEAFIYSDPPGAPPRNVVGHWGLGSANTGSWALYLSSLKPTLGVSCDGTLSGNYQFVMSATPLLVQRWYHVAAVFNPTTQTGTVWVDGALAASGPITCSAAHATTNIPLELAYDDPEGGDSFLGELDEVRLSSGLRYTVPFQPAARLTADATTLALFHFDPPESTGTSAADSSSQTNPAVLGASAALTQHCR